MDSLTIIFILNGVFFISFFLLKNIHIPLILSLITLLVLFFVTKQRKIPTFQASLKLRGILSYNNQYIVTIACLIMLIVLEKFIGFNAALFLAFFIFAFLNRLSSRAGFVMALVFFVVTVLFTISNNTDAAKDMIVLVYYFLVIGVIWQIVEVRKENPGDEEEEMIPEQKKKEKVTVASNTFMRQYKSTYNFFTKKNIAIAGIFIFVCLGVVLYFLHLKFGGREYPAIISTNTPIITPTSTPLRHVPFIILNATDIRGYAGSSAATLRNAGWDKEFDFTVGNYDGTASANILRYTTVLKDKIKLLESDLDIQVTPIMIKDATRAAEMTLILGK